MAEESFEELEPGSGGTSAERELVIVPAGLTPDGLRNWLADAEPRSVKSEMFGRRSLRCPHCWHLGPASEHGGFSYCGNCHRIIRRTEPRRSVKEEADRLHG